MIEIKKKEGESASALMFRFSKKVRQSGLVTEVRRRRFKKRPENKNKRRLSALYRAGKKVETARLKKLGLA
ncbi:MAG: 30S ribosomal protein S21 [Patescibacteria group bacterium]